MNTDYAIVEFQKKDGKIDFNKAILCYGDDEIRIEHLTKSGYFSRKSLFIDVDFSESVECKQPILYVSKKTADYIKENFCNLNGRVWVNPNSTPISRHLAIANFITKNGTDPYDRGQMF